MSWFDHHDIEAADFFDEEVWPREALIDLYIDMEEFAPVDLHTAMVIRGIDVSAL